MRIKGCNESLSCLYLQRCSHDNEKVCQWKVLDVLEEVTWEFLSEKHDVRLHHACTRRALGDDRLHHVTLPGVVTEERTKSTKGSITHNTLATYILSP